MQVATAAREQHAAWVAVPEYDVASELAWALRSDPRVIGVDPRWGLTALPPATAASGPGLLVWPVHAPVPSTWPGATRIGTLRREQQGLALYRIDGLPGTAAVAWLPRGG